MHLDIIGSGPPLLLIHGWAMHGGVFAPLVERLKADFQCWLVDLPGHGLSEERATVDLEQTAERLLDLVPAGTHWLGWSLGGQLVLDAVSLAPERIAAVIMIASSPRFVSGDDWPYAVSESVFAGFATELENNFQRTIDRFLALEVHGDDAAREELRSLRDCIATRPPSDPAVLRTGLEWLRSRDDRARVARIRCPSLWLAGLRDRLVPAAAMRWAAQACGGDFADWPCGHAPFLSHADSIAHAIRGFLTRR